MNLQIKNKTPKLFCIVDLIIDKAIQESTVVLMNQNNGFLEKKGSITKIKTDGQSFSGFGILLSLDLSCAYMNNHC